MLVLQTIINLSAFVSSLREAVILAFFMQAVLFYDSYGSASGRTFDWSYKK